MTVCEFKKYSVWGYDKFLQTHDLTSPSRRLVEDDMLKIHCRVWIEGDLRHRVGVGGHFVAVNMEDTNKRNNAELVSTFNDLLVDTKWADVAIITPSKTFMAHKVFLSARSSVFRAMLDTPMLESAHSTIEIPDFDEQVVQGMLEFIYTGEVKDLKDMADDLMQIGEKYDLQGLKAIGEGAVAQSLTVENAVEVLVLADLHNATTLKAKTISFIKQNEEDVRKTQAFQDAAKSNKSIIADIYLAQ